MMTQDEAGALWRDYRISFEQAGLRIDGVEPMPNAPEAWALRFHCLCAGEHPRLFVSDQRNGALYLISKTHAIRLMQRHLPHYQHFLAFVDAVMPMTSKTSVVVPNGTRKSRHP